MIHGETAVKHFSLVRCTLVTVSHVDVNGVTVTTKSVEESAEESEVSSLSPRKRREGEEGARQQKLKGKEYGAEPLTTGETSACS